MKPRQHPEYMIGEEAQEPYREPDDALERHRIELDRHRAEVDHQRAEIDHHRAEVDRHHAEPGYKPAEAYAEQHQEGRPPEVIYMSKATTTMIVYDYETQIKMDEDNIIPGLGDHGDPVKVVPYTSEEEIEKCMKKEAFNKILSDKISLTRKIPDARHPLYESSIS